MDTLLAGGITKKVAALVVGGILLAGTNLGGPATKDQVCSGYEDLTRELTEVNGFFDNSLFRSAERLGKLASKFEGNPSVQSDGESLKRIGNADSTSGMELQNASLNIAGLCGKPPLAINTFWGQPAN